MEGLYKYLSLSYYVTLGRRCTSPHGTIYTLTFLLLDQHSLLKTNFKLLLQDKKKENKVKQNLVRDEYSLD